MIYNLNSVKDFILLNKTKGIERANTYDIDSLLKEINKNKRGLYSKNKRLIELNSKINSLQSIMKETYIELVTTDIKTLNLNTAADSIKERNDFVNSICDTVTESLLSTAYK